MPPSLVAICEEKRGSKAGRWELVPFGVYRREFCPVGGGMRKTRFQAAGSLQVHVPGVSVTGRSLCLKLPCTDSHLAYTLLGTCAQSWRRLREGQVQRGRESEPGCRDRLEFDQIWLQS